MFGRAVLTALLLVLGTGLADAQRTRRASVAFRACDAKGACPEGSEIKKLYDQEPTIELVTMGIGALAWERHGHIALCIRWKNSANDICYNYGIGNFREPLGMAWGFFRGTHSFWAGEQRVEDLIRIYVGANRTMWAQPIPLTADQKQKVIAKLEADTAPLPADVQAPRPGRTPGTNLYYAYDHFWDNCTTRVRDILDDATGGALRSLQDTETDGKTFRELARDGFYGMKGFLLITDIAMGRVTDRVPDYWERMFLPQFLREGVEKKWGIKPIILYQRQPDIAVPPGADPKADADGNGLADIEEDKDRHSGRLVLALVILLLTAPAVIGRYFGKLPRASLAFAVIPYVLLGSILWFLAIISPLPYVKWNESLLLLLPLDVLLLGFVASDKRRLYARGRIVMIGLFVLLSLVGIFKQPILEVALWPLVPAFVVGFWKPEWSKKQPETKPSPSKDDGEKNKKAA